MQLIGYEQWYTKCIHRDEDDLAVAYQTEAKQEVVLILHPTPYSTQNTSGLTFGKCEGERSPEFTQVP